MEFQTIIVFSLFIMSSIYIFVKVIMNRLAGKKSANNCGPDCKCG